MNINISQQDIVQLDKLFSSIDVDISASLSYVRRAQNLSFSDLASRFTGLNASTLKRYMQQSYPSVRPLHVVAALSWVMMVPMTAFYQCLNIRESYRGMDDNAVKALLSIGRVPSSQFELFINMMLECADELDRQTFNEYRESLYQEFGQSQGYAELFPPEPLDIDAFAIDYYRSVAIGANQLRTEANLSYDQMAEILGLSEYQYSVLEDKNKVVHLPVSVGFRVKMAFQLFSHVSFTSEMRAFPQFHHLRREQHIRDSLTVAAMQLVPPNRREHVTSILISLSKIYQ